MCNKSRLYLSIVCKILKINLKAYNILAQVEGVVLELEKSIDETGIHKMSYLLTDICRFTEVNVPWD